MTEFKAEHIFTILTIINAFFVTFVVFMQYRISKNKFKLDLFDRRYGVYKATQVFLSKIFQNAGCKLEDLFEFRKGTQDSAFLFGDDITDYLKSIDSKALSLQTIQAELEDIPAGEERSKLRGEQEQAQGWLIKQLPELINKFKPYLAFKKWK